jgi:hypothetical protein
MGRSTEDMQNNALYHMDKLSKQVGNARENKVLSLAEQLANVEKTKGKELFLMEWHDWLRHVHSKLKENRMSISGGAFDYVTSKYRRKLEEMKEKSTVREALLFIDEHAIEWMNL